MTNQQTHRPSEQGFTLVELAIVMVIIGLLLGGILKGQELINSARLSSQITLVKSTDAALNTFQDKYNALPGDILNPSNRLPNCNAAPCNTAIAAGTGNGQIGSVIVAPTNANESGLAFVHLAAADLIGGINPAGSLITFGNMLPTNKLGPGGLWVAYATAAAPGGTALGQNRHYVIMRGDQTVPASDTAGAFTPVQASQIDTKLDDGVPNTGATQTVGTGCVNAANYTVATESAVCTVLSRVLN